MVGGRGAVRLTVLRMLAHKSRRQSNHRTAGVAGSSVSVHRFLGWCRSVGITVDPAVGISKHAVGGRGLVARKPLTPGALLIRVPQFAMLAAHNSGAWGAGLSESNKSLEPADLLILAMAWELQQGADSRWSTWLRFLPIEAPVPLFWDKVC